MKNLDISIMSAGKDKYKVKGCKSLISLSKNGPLDCIFRFQHIPSSLGYKVPKKSSKKVQRDYFLNISYECLWLNHHFWFQYNASKVAELAKVKRTTDHDSCSILFFPDQRWIFNLIRVYEINWRYVFSKRNGRR